jgi:hypothetical protein
MIFNVNSLNRHFKNIVTRNIEVSRTARFLTVIFCVFMTGVLCSCSSLSPKPDKLALDRIDCLIKVSEIKDGGDTYYLAEGFFFSQKAYSTDEKCPLKAAVPNVDSNPTSISITSNQTGLSENRQAELLSHPKVLVRPGTKATIQMIRSDDIPIKTRFTAGGQEETIEHQAGICFLVTITVKDSSTVHAVGAFLLSGHIGGSLVTRVFPLDTDCVLGETKVFYSSEASWPDPAGR